MSSWPEDVKSKLFDDGRVTDWGRLQSAKINDTKRPETVAKLRAIIHKAKAENLKLSIRGIGHSAGGQSICPGGIMIDIRALNQILDLDEQAQTVTVQTGADWAVLTEALEPLGLAVSTKQEFDTFTIGGSIAANVHGKSIAYGPLIDNILSFRLMNADGEIIQVSRSENAELFPAVIGGYGLFGVVTDVTLQLVVDRVVEKTEVVFMNAAPLVDSYLERVRRVPPLCYGFLNNDCTRGFYVTYDAIERAGYELDQLERDGTSPALFNKFIALQRHSKLLRERAFCFMWSGSSTPEVTLESRRLLLWDRGPRAFDDMLLQKYFVPAERFGSYLARIGPIFDRYADHLPLLTNHFRFVPGNDAAIMSFAPRDAVCLIPCYLARKDDPRWVAKLEEATHELLDATLAEGGSYYLTFDIIPTREQFQQAYPRYQEFFALKRQYDPETRFSSIFYEKYAS